jgi:DNA-binding response OmpR family regulator
MMGKNDMAHILIVDDDAYIAKLLSVRLERSGHSTIWASDGNQALARARAQAPDLILLDVMLPGMNGFAVLKHLKQNQATRAIPVMMLTAQTDGNSVHTGIDCGAEAYLTKPFDFLDLIQRLERCLTRRAALGLISPYGG